MRELVYYILLFSLITIHLYAPNSSAQFKILEGLVSPAKITEVTERLSKWPQIYRKRFFENLSQIREKIIEDTKPQKGIFKRQIIPPKYKSFEEGFIKVFNRLDEIVKSFEYPVYKGRRINATSEDVRRFYEQENPRIEGTIERVFNGRKMILRKDLLEKAKQWSERFSHNLTTETSGRFIFAVRRNVLEMIDFVPISCFSLSTLYRDHEKDKSIKLHIDKLRSISNYPEIFGYDPSLEIKLDYKGEITLANYHSHFLDSEYQQSPSSSDFKEHGPSYNILFTPGKDGRSPRFIIYNMDSGEYLDVGENQLYDFNNGKPKKIRKQKGVKSPKKKAEQSKKKPQGEKTRKRKRTLSTRGSKCSATFE